MTHAEARASYPVREPFGAPDRPTIDQWGRAFERAKARAMDLGLVHVRREGEINSDTLTALDGVILPGLSDDDPPVPAIARWLGAVTLYYQPRAGGAAHVR